MWTIVHFEESFINPLEKRADELTKRLSNPPADEKELTKLIAEWEELGSFMAAISRFKESSEPLTSLKPACESDGTIVPDYFVLRSAPWSAYYHVDATQRLCSGLTIQRDGTTIEAIGTMLTYIFGRWLGTRGRGGGKPG